MPTWTMEIKKNNWKLRESLVVKLWNQYLSHQKREINTIKLKQKQKAILSQKLKKILNKIPLQEIIGEFEHKLEKGERLKKNGLIDIFYEVEQRYNEESAAVTIEKTTEEYKENVWMLECLWKKKEVIKTYHILILINLIVVPNVLKLFQYFFQFFCSVFIVKETKKVVLIEVFNAERNNTEKMQN